MKKLSTANIMSEMHADIKEIKEKLIPEMHKEIAILKVKNTIWSGMSGIIGGAIAAIGLTFSHPR